MESLLLPNQSQTELDLPRTRQSVPDGSRRRVRRAALQQDRFDHGVAKVRPVEKVEELRSQLELEIFREPANRSCLVRRKVKCRYSRADQGSNVFTKG